MDTKTRGAWLIHHAKKLQRSTNQDFDQIAFAGKCGILLSAISSASQSQLEIKKVRALAKANQISPKGELPTLLDELARQRFIEISGEHIEVLGLTTATVLDHAVKIFGEAGPEPHEEAVVALSEKASVAPILQQDAAEYASDTFKVSSNEARELITKGTEIGFFDAEEASKTDRLLFNGNLFRVENLKKTKAVLDSLKATESKQMAELNSVLSAKGCITLQEAHRIVNKEVFEKLHSIGLFDVNSVGNESGKHFFVTKPAAFSKFTKTLADDAFDLAKAMVSSLTYGMTISAYSRGRIQMITLLVNKLINGGWVGPATAIGKDYQALEYRGVVEVKESGGGMFRMRLLKPEVGRLALAVIQEGGVTTETLSSIPGATVTHYGAPEENREVVRKTMSEPLKKSATALLDEIRTGGFKG
jgi:hypothetical protein